MSDVNPSSARRSGDDHPQRGSDLNLPDVRKLWATFARRTGLFTVVASLVFLFWLLLSLQATPTYQASADVLIESLHRASFDLQNAGLGAPSDNNAIDTQLELVTSQEVTARVVRRLGLAEDPEFAARASGATHRPNKLRLILSNPAALFQGARPETQIATPPPQLAQVDGVSQAVINNVQAHIRARRAGLTYVIQITAISLSPERAAQLANAYAEEYIQAGLKSKLDYARSASGALGDQLSKLQEDVVAADTAVQDYKISHNLMNASNGTMAEQEVSALNQQIASARADAAEKDAKLSSARAQISRGGNGEDVGAALGSENISRLRAQESEIIKDLTELTTRYGDKFPTVQKDRNQLAEVRQQIRQEIGRIMSSLEADAQAAHQRVDSLSSSQSQAKGALTANNAAGAGLLELQRKADASKTVYEAFLNRAKETSAQASVQQADARVVTVAERPTWPASPNLRLSAMFGVVIAVLCGLAAIGIAELLDSSVKTGSEVESRFGLHYAGSIPTLRTTNRKISSRVRAEDYILDNPFSTFAEAFRSLRTFLVLQEADAGMAKVIAITSALPGEGKSLTTVCLARTLASMGSRVALIDGDVRRRGASSFVRNGEADVVQVLRGEASLESALVKDERADVWFLPVFDAPRDGVDLFATESMRELVGRLREEFDFVLIDTAPVLAVSDTRILAEMADKVLVVVRWGKTPFTAADTAIDLVLEAGAEVAGIALTQVNLRQQSRFGYGDQAYYYKALRKYYSG